MQTNESAIVLQEKVPLYAVKIFSSSEYNENFEEFENDCQHFQLLTPKGPVCACADNFTIDPKNANLCSEIKNVPTVENPIRCPATLDPSGLFKNYHLKI